MVLVTQRQIYIQYKAGRDIEKKIKPVQAQRQTKKIRVNRINKEKRQKI
jgi:hypothetical protein